MKNRLERGEFVQAIVVPLRERTLRAYKLSKRYDCDISALCAGLSIERDAAGVVREARFAFGGMAAVVKRAARAEAAVVGAAVDRGDVERGDGRAGVGLHAAGGFARERGVPDGSCAAAAAAVLAGDAGRGTAAGSSRSTCGPSRHEDAPRRLTPLPLAGEGRGEGAAEAFRHPLPGPLPAGGDGHTNPPTST